MRKFLTVAAAIALMPGSFSLAQDSPSLRPKATPNVSETAEQRAPLILEISYNPQIPPAFLNVHNAQAKPSWIWVTRFVRLPTWQPSQDLPKTRAVRIEPRYNGETVDVRVTLLRGETTFDQEDLVGNYHLGLGESRTIQQLESFGIQAFEISLTNAVPPAPPAPYIDNRTRTVEVVGIKVENLPLPAYRIQFRNLTNKTISALQVDVLRGVTTLFQGKEGRPLIEQGGFSEEYLPAVKPELRGGSYVPGTAESNTIMIRSVVFSDGSFDGAAEPACLFESFTVARRRWLSSVVKFLEEELANLNENDPTAASQLKDRFLALRYEDAGESKRPARVPSQCNVSNRAADSSLKLQFLRDLDQVINSRTFPPINFKTWLQSNQRRYRDWLMRLSEAAVENK
jgi:hypothetical protein